MANRLKDAEGCVLTGEETFYLRAFRRDFSLTELATHFDVPAWVVLMNLDQFGVDVMKPDYLMTEVELLERALREYAALEERLLLCWC